jgi:mannitol/fructose-specific phosphotransferase system IIA component (Ntr-type)
MRISDRVKKRNIFIDLQAGGREAVLREMVGRLHENGELGSASPDDVVKRLIDRENKGSTGFGAGVALPHVKSNELPGTVIAIGRSDEGVDFNATDGEPVHTIFLILSPEDDAEVHLQSLKWIVTLAQSRYYSRLLRGSKTVEQISDLLREFEDEESGA